MNHGSAKDFLRRFWIVTVLLVPLLLTNATVASLLGFESVWFGKWIGFALATIIFGFSLVFFEHAWHEIRARKYGMMTLVSLAVGSGYLFSVVSAFVPALEVEFYLEISTLIWVLLFGHYLEARSSAAAGDALEEVAKLLPKEAHKIVNGKEEDVAVDLLSVGDVVLVKPGEKFPADGIVAEGTAHVNESLISGESKPVEKKEGAEVIAGSICLNGSLFVKISRIGEHSTIGQIKTLIEEAKKTKPNSQKIADKASGVLTLVAGTTAIGTIIVWSLLLGYPFVFSITLAITVLVIACPHALGLAIPTVTTITTSLAAKNGFFIKDLSKIEVAKNVTHVVFDKTGTLTEGRFGVTEIFEGTGYSKEDIVRIAASLEQHSSHVIGESIVLHATTEKITLSPPRDFKNIPGKGVSGGIDGVEYFVGNKRLVEEQGVIIPNISSSDTAVFVATKDAFVGAIMLADSIKQGSKEVVENLHAMDIEVVMITGDNDAVAKRVANTLGIDIYFAGVLPGEKYTHIQDLQKKGGVVLMVGDGVNDAPALMQADVGIAVGAGTDVAVEAGDVVLTDSNPLDIVRFIRLSKKVYVKMVQNLVWALGYNVVAIPIAAGALAFWGIFLRPELGALLMSLSTVVVVLNALMLRRVNLG